MGITTWIFEQKTENYGYKGHRQLDAISSAVTCFQDGKIFMQQVRGVDIFTFPI